MLPSRLFFLHTIQFRSQQLQALYKSRVLVSWEDALNELIFLIICRVSLQDKLRKKKKKTLHAAGFKKIVTDSIPLSHHIESCSTMLWL